MTSQKRRSAKCALVEMPPEKRNEYITMGFHPCRCDNKCENNPDRGEEKIFGYCNAPMMKQGSQHVFGQITVDQYAMIATLGCYAYSGIARIQGW